MTADELDPVKIREALTPHKRRGIPFDMAWTFVAGPDPQKMDPAGLRSFMRKHFGAAYRNTPTALGRFQAPDAEQGRSPLPRVPVCDDRRADRCKSGDGCDHLAGHGRFGSFCQRHADELARLDMSASFSEWGTQAIRGRRAA